MSSPSLTLSNLLFLFWLNIGIIPNPGSSIKSLFVEFFILFAHCICNSNCFFTCSFYLPPHAYLQPLFAALPPFLVHHVITSIPMFDSLPEERQDEFTTKFTDAEDKLADLAYRMANATEENAVELLAEGPLKVEAFRSRERVEKGAEVSDNSERQLFLPIVLSVNR